MRAEPVLEGGQGGLAPLLQRIDETSRWCAARLHLPYLKESLRSEVTRPWLLAQHRAGMVERVAAARARAVKEEGADPARDGRLLVYFPDRTQSDGAAELVTTGFFDRHDVPAWDTWVGCFADGDGTAVLAEYLLCWVPAPLARLVDAGLRANEALCLNWLADSETALFRRLASEAAYLCR
jgi:hypothetical protein